MKNIVYTLNVFAETSKGGNPAGVLLNADSLSDTDMLTIANQVGFSETAFIMKSKNADYKLRTEYRKWKKQLRNKPKILRLGGLDINDIKKILGKKILININPAKVSAPGQFKTHYSPGIPIRLNVKKIKKGEAYLMFKKKKLNRPGTEILDGLILSGIFFFKIF